jgi:hypothetical protein
MAKVDGIERIRPDLLNSEYPISNKEPQNVEGV